MNLQNFSTKFIYFSLESDKDLAEKFKQDLELKSKSIDLDTKTSEQALGVLDEEDNLDLATAKSREILTGVNKANLVNDLANQSDLFSEKTDAHSMLPLLQEYFQKYLQQNSIESLSPEEWQKVMGDVAPEISNIYLEASKERQKEILSPEKMDTELSSLLKNSQPLEKSLWEEGVVGPENVLKFIEKNPENLSDELKDFFESSTDKDFLLKNSLKKVSDKFERRRESVALKTAETKDLVESFPEKIVGTSGWEKLDSDELNKLFVAEFKEIDLNKFPGYVASKLIKDLIKVLKMPLQEAKGKVFEKQIEKKKLGTAEKIIDWVFEKDKDSVGKSDKDLEKSIDEFLDINRLGKSLPDKYKKILEEKIKELKKEKISEYLDKQEKTAELEDKDKISRNKMKENWESWVSHLSDYSKDFKNSRDFQKAFIKKYFANNPKEAEKYFEKHSNYAKSFEKSFKQYETAQTSFFDKKINQISAKLSDKRVSNSMKISFKNAQNNKQKREWLDYLNKNITGYEKSIQNSAKLESRLTNGFKTLKAHPKIAKIREKFSLTQKSRQFLNNKNQYISPRDYESDLKKLDKEFSAIEKKDKIDRTLAEKNIAKLSVKDFNLKNSRIKNQTDFAKSGKIKMPEYLWQEFGKDSYKAKIRELYPKYLEAKEGGLEKSPSVKFAKETIKKLNYENLDFSRDFATQQSFNRQRHLRNNVSFAPGVWEIVKDDFFQKSETLYKEHQEIRKEMTTLSKSIKGLKPANLDFDKDYKNLREFSHQPKFFEFFKNQKVSNRAYDKVKNSEFIPKVLELYGDYLKQKESPENSPETKKEREIIENIELKDLDISQDFANFTEFKRQPFLRKTVSFDHDIWKKVQPNFEQKAFQLYADQIKVREEQKKFEKALSTLTTDDLETSFDNFAGFVKQPAMQKFFTELNISDRAYDNLTDDFAVKMDELWESVKDTESDEEFSDKDMQKMGTKHGLDFFKLSLDNNENLELKFERLDKLLTRSSSLRNFLRKKEEHLLPVVLGFLGEMNNEDFKRLDEDLGTTEKTESEIVDVLFNSPRRKYLLSETRKNYADAWRKLQIAEKQFEGDLSIRDIILTNKEIEQEDEDFENEDELEFDEDGNPIEKEEGEENIEEINDNNLEESTENLDADSLEEKDDNDSESREILDEELEDEESEDENDIEEINLDEEIDIDEKAEEETEEDLESREILDADNLEKDDSETESLEVNEKVSEASEINESNTKDDLEVPVDEKVKDIPEEDEDSLYEDVDTDKDENTEEIDEETEADLESREISEEDLENEADESEDNLEEEIKEQEELEKEEEEKQALEDEEAAKAEEMEKAKLEEQEAEQELEEELEKEEEEEQDLEDEEMEKAEEMEKTKLEEQEAEQELEEELEKEEEEEQALEDEETEKAEEIEKTKEEKEKSEQVEKKEEEKLNVEEEELKYREKIMENIKQQEKHEQSVEEKQERIKEEQEMIRRLLEQERKREEGEKKGKKEIAEAGDESSLSDNMSDDLKQKKSPHNFAEIHCSEVMQLGVLLSKVHFYLELLAEKDIPFQINLSDKEMKREVKNSRETFLRIVEFLLEKDVFGVNKVSFRAFNFSENKCSIKSEVQYGENISSQKFEVGLLGRG